MFSGARSSNFKLNYTVAEKNDGREQLVAKHPVSMPEATAESKSQDGSLLVRVRNCG